METGTRHRTAERVSKQTKALVIAISQRRDVVSLYVEGIKYILQDIPTVLSKANQGLATLEKYRARLDQVSARLTAARVRGRRRPLRRALGAAARRARHPHGRRGRALHHRARLRGPPDRDAARGDWSSASWPSAPRSCATTSPSTPEPASRAPLARARPPRPPGPARLRPPRRAARLRPQDQHARLSRHAAWLPRALARPAAAAPGGSEDRRPFRRPRGDPRRRRQELGGGRGGGGDPCEGHPRGPSPTSGGRRRRPLP